jgi:hypothetical protein
MRHPTILNACALVLPLIAVASCSRDDVVAAPSSPSSPPSSPAVLGSAVAPNVNNALSLIVSARVRRADSVAVRYGTSTSLDSISPAVKASGDSAIIPVLGLLPGTAYNLNVVAFGSGRVVTGELLSFTTDTLPEDLPHFTTSGDDPSPGYVVFGSGRYGLAIDNTGRVVWYHRFRDGPGLNFEAEPTGTYVARPTTPDPNDLDPWVEIDPSGNAVRTFGCARNLQSRFHDLITEADGAYWIMCDQVRTMDLSDMGGNKGAKVMGTVVQHVSATGQLLFEWSPFDAFDVADLDSASRSGSSVNWTHGNSIDLDADGNLLVSFRNLNEITKIDTRTGAVLWRMGGTRNQFTFEGARTPPFAFQHALRSTGPGEFVLLDNMGDPTVSRVERFTYDATTRTARMTGSYAPEPAAISQTGGSAQTLPNGRTLVSFGPAGRVEEVDSAGRVMWRIEGNPGYVFRAQRVRSLYRPGVGTPR